MTNYTFEYLDQYETISSLKQILTSMGGTPGVKSRLELINEILDIQSGKCEPIRSKRGRPRKSQPICSDFGFGNLAVRDNAVPFKYDTEIEGVLEVVDAKYGFVRSLDHFSPLEAYISKATINKYNVHSGDFVCGELEYKREAELPEVTKIIRVNGHEPLDENKLRWSEIPAVYPNEKIELSGDDVTLNAIDAFSPIGKGQRVVIKSEGAFDTLSIVKKIINKVSNSQPEICVTMLMVDESPEDIADIAANYDVELFSSTFDKSKDYHHRMSELAFARSKRIAEEGKNSLLIIDSIKKIIKNQSYGSAEPIDVQGFYFLKRLLSVTKNTVGGSLTTVLISENSSNADVKAATLDLIDTANCVIYESTDRTEIEADLLVDIENSFTKRAELFDKSFLKAQELRHLLKTKKINSLAAIKQITDKK